MTLARTIIIIGICLGLLGAVTRIGTYLFGSTFLEDYQRYAIRDDDSSAIRRFQTSITRTPVNLVKLTLHAVLVVGGGVLGILAARKRPVARRVFLGFAAAACGVALAALGAWLAAIGYALGGALIVLGRESGPPGRVDGPRAHEAGR